MADKPETFVKPERHDCASFRDGDWIIYDCPKCDYVRRENWRTGELQVNNSNSRINVKHFGAYFPSEYKEALENVN